MASPKLEPLTLSHDERQVLQGWAQRRTTAQALARRSRIVLACDGGAAVTAVADELGTSRATAAKWRSRFLRDRLEGLADAPRPGRPRTITDQHVQKVVTATLETQPPDGDARWSTRSMARQAGMSQTAISRIWRAFGLRPHLVHAWTLSTDPQFTGKVRDVAGLYLDPPDRALVLCVDEVSQMPASDRTARGLPSRSGGPAQMTRADGRGTTSLSAALDAASNPGIAQHDRRRRHQQFLRFLRQIDQAVPDELDLHLICGNPATCQAPQIRNWLARHPRFTLHFTPATSSWLAVAERWFAEIGGRELPRSAPSSITELDTAIRAWASGRDANPGPFTWATTTGQIRKALTVDREEINNSVHYSEPLPPDQTSPKDDRAKLRGTTTLPAERRDLLLARLARDGKLVARDLAAELGLSDDSIRRDLRELAAAGLCQRVYGGALPASPLLGTPTHTGRSRIAPDSKRRVGTTAAGLIRPGATVILDAGTTALEVVAALPRDLDATIITHSATTAAALASHPAVKVFLLGGLLNKQNISVWGTTAAEAATSITADIALLVLPGIHPQAEFTIGEPEDAAMKRILISRAADTYIMASTDKLGTAFPYKVTGLSDVAGIITDAPASHPAVHELRRQGVTIIQAA